MPVPVGEESLAKIVELAGQLTKNAQHPSSAMTDERNAEDILQYRLDLFNRAVKALYLAVLQSDQPEKR